MSRRLAVVVAHPDDDTFACAGTVALHDDDDEFRFVLVHVTSGEAGMIADPALATRETLGAVREGEDERSWEALGRTPDRHEWLRCPDGGVTGVPFDALVDQIAAILAEERPDSVVTFGPDGVTGHPDHITTGLATTAAFHRLRDTPGGGFARLFHNGVPQSVLDRWNEARIASGEAPFDPERVFDPHGVPDDTIGLVVDCRAVASRVVAALREHATQAADFGGESDEQMLEGLGQEHAVIAWPPWQPGDPILTDVFG